MDERMLYPCAVCGKVPNVFVYRHGKTDLTVVECVNPKCYARPVVQHVDRAEALKKWQEANCNQKGWF